MVRLAALVAILIGLVGCGGAAALPSSGTALLECDGAPSEVGGSGEGLSTDTGGATPDEALAAFLAASPFVIPTSGYEAIAQAGDRHAYGYLVDGLAKAVIVVAPSTGEVTDAAYTVVELRTCPQSEFGSGASFDDGRRIWTHPDTGAILTDFAGAEHCGWQSVRFLDVETVAGRPPAQFIRDEEGVLAGYPGLDRFETVDQLPSDATDTGYRSSDGLELWIAADASAAFVVTPDGVERWPRAREMVGCR
jgi:hypothetical protein